MSKTLYIMMLVFVVTYFSILTTLEAGDSSIGGVQASCYWEDVTYLPDSNYTYAEVFGEEINGYYYEDIGTLNYQRDYNNVVQSTTGWGVTVKTTTVAFSINLESELGYKKPINSNTAPIVAFRIGNDIYNVDYAVAIVGTDVEGFSISGSNGNIIVSLLKSKLGGDSSADFESYLKANDVTFIYELSESYTGLTYLEEIYNTETSRTQVQFEEDMAKWESKLGKKVPCDYEFQTDSTDDIDGYDLGNAKIREIFTTLTNPFLVLQKFIEEAYDLTLGAAIDSLSDSLAAYNSTNDSTEYYTYDWETDTNATVTIFRNILDWVTFWNND